MGAASVITIPLKTEKWQEDVLYKRMEACRSVYNSMLTERMKTYRKILSSKEYKECIDIIYSAYKTDDEKEKKQIKKSAEYNIDTTSITIFDGEDITVLDIGFEDTKQNKVAKLSTYMNTSRQINNSDNYNEDGTIKKGIIKNGRKIPLTWHYSMGYYKAKDYLANIRRIQAEQRKIRAGILANRILEMGYDIHIKDYRSVYAKELINR